MKLTIKGERSEPETIFWVRAKIDEESFEKSDFKFNLELSEFLNWT